MSGRSAELARRIEDIRQLSAAASAMRRVAAARMREAEARLAGARGYTATVSQALGDAISVMPHAAHPAPSGGHRHAVIAICAEQGFVGGFDDRVLEAVRAEAPTDLLLIGLRAADAARAEGLPLRWSAPMAAHADQAAPLADRAAQALLAPEEGGPSARATLAHALPGASPRRIARRTLVFGRFMPPPPGRSPQLTLPPESSSRGGPRSIRSRSCAKA